MYGFESWTIQKAEHWRTDVFELWCWRRLLRVPLDCKKIKPVHLQGNKLNIHWKDWRWGWNSNTWPPDANSQLIGKDPDAGKDWGWEEKGMTKDEMAGWHHWFKGHEFEQIMGDTEGQGSLACCSSWDHKELDTTEQMNNSNINAIIRWSYIYVVSWVGIFWKMIMLMMIWTPLKVMI